MIPKSWKAVLAMKAIALGEGEVVKHVNTALLRMKKRKSLLFKFAKKTIASKSSLGPSLSKLSLQLAEKGRFGLMKLKPS